MITRRSLIGGLAVALAAPAIVRTPGLLMRVRPMIVLGDGVALQSALHPAALDDRPDLTLEFELNEASLETVLLNLRFGPSVFFWPDRGVRPVS